MRQIMLCDGPVTVQIEARGNGAVLKMTNEEHVEFSLAKRNLDAVLDGETIQISRAGIFCRLTRREDGIHVSFAWKSHHESVTCEVSHFQSLVDTLNDDKRDVSPSH